MFQMCALLHGNLESKILVFIDKIGLTLIIFLFIYFLCSFSLHLSKVSNRCDDVCVAMYD